MSGYPPCSEMTLVMRGYDPDPGSLAYKEKRDPQEDPVRSDYTTLMVFTLVDGDELNLGSCSLIG
jgi:hypothetical protein